MKCLIHNVEMELTDCILIRYKCSYCKTYKWLKSNELPPLGSRYIKSERLESDSEEMHLYEVKNDE